MVIGSASVQKTGMITLPKQWRDRHPATTVFFEETHEGLLVRPYDDIQYWEDDKGNFGLHFPGGMEMGRFLEKYEKALKRVEADEASIQLKKRKRSHRQ